MWELIAVGVLLADYVWHRWINPDELDRKAPNEVQIPRVDGDAPISMVYGRCRVRAPILAWVSEPGFDFANGDEDQPRAYVMDMLFVLGLPASVNATSRLRRMWVGDVEARKDIPSEPELADSTGGGGVVHTPYFGFNSPRVNTFDAIANNGDATFGRVEFLDGRANQVVGSNVGTTEATAGHTYAGWNMSIVWTQVSDGISSSSYVSSAKLPDFRGYMLAFLWNNSGFSRWVVSGRSPRVDAYSFEVSTYTNNPLGSSALIGDDANPVDVLFDAFTNPRKLGFSQTLFDAPSFAAVANVLAAEGMGYSREIAAVEDASETINEILRMIDGVLYVDERIGRIVIKLIRPDYDPALVPNLNPTNCESLQNVAAGGRSNLTNKVKVTFSDRLRNYQDNYVTAQNQANASGQNGFVVPISLKFPCVTTEAQARKIATRELSSRSRPLAKFTAVVDRSALRVYPGHAVTVTWPEFGISNLAMRVAKVNRGTLASNKISLDLLQDSYYVHRGGLAGSSGTLDSFPAAP